MTETTFSPSTAAKPDLDWSQIRETTRMLELAVAQIAMALHEGNDSIDRLLASFTGMIDNIQAVRAGLENLRHSCPEGDTTPLQQHFGNLSQSIDEAIVAFQFYDRLSQRLTHVSGGLGSMAELIGQADRLYHPGEWHQLQQFIRSKYTMIEEQAMFDAVLAGQSVDQVLAAWPPREKASDQGSGDLEFF